MRHDILVRKPGETTLKMLTTYNDVEALIFEWEHKMQGYEVVAHEVNEK